jgi:hypothetical protein
MKLLMLQRIDPHTKENVGGLYINPSHISALIPKRIAQYSYTSILLSNGIEYLTPFPISEILEMLEN